MTAVLEGPTSTKRPANATATTWTAVQAGLWVGRRGGEFAGMIEQKWGEGYVVTTRLGKTLGSYDTLEDAQKALR